MRAKKVIGYGAILLLVICASFLIFRVMRKHSPEIKVFYQAKRPLNIAHRGGMALWPENTLHAFEQAVALGVDVLELDVRPTSDRQIVVIHDPTVDRTTNYTGRVDQMTLVELKKMDFAYNFIPVGKNEPLLRGKGITIPTLQEVFQRFPDCNFNIEIKPDSAEFAVLVVELIRQYNMNDRVLLASFHKKVMSALKSVSNEIAIVADVREVRNMIMLSKFGFQIFHHPVGNVYEVPIRRSSIEIIKSSFVKAAHAKGQEVYAWTIDDSSQMIQLLNLGVDGIVTNRPDILARILKEFESGPENSISRLRGVITNKNNDELKRIDKFYFLIHALCYAEMARNKNYSELDTNFIKYLDFEKSRAEKWRSRLQDLAENEALIIIPWPSKENGPASEYNSLAHSILGDRCFILDCPDSFDSVFWSDNSEDFQQAVINELKSALIYQKDQWNDEELHTALHSLACCRQLNSMMLQRGYYFNKAQVLAESWGASFDGCVTKYTLNIRRILNLSNVIKINFNLTVPDAAFLLTASFSESVLLANGLRLFLFRKGNQSIGLYTMTSHALKNQATFIQLSLDQKRVTVMSKQGIRLWPISEPYHLPQTAIAHYEPVQELVTFENNKIHLPVSAGFVYRLAKAPVYVVAGPDLPYQEFKELLLNAEIKDD